jgi:long-chain fatty acid transport protein
MKPIIRLIHQVHFLIFVALIVTVTSTAFGAGFQISEQSGTGLGRAFAGFGVINDDLSNAFYNPAGLTLKKGTQIQVSGYLIDGKSRFSADEAQSGRAPSPPLTTPLGENDDGATFALVPNLYFTMDLTDRLKYGFSISSPFGLATDYDRDWVGRYQAKESELITININPSLAYKVSESFSIGAGLVAEYAEATLSQAIFTGGPDGFAEVKGDDWSYGWNIGVMYHPSSTFRAGIGYRSKIGHELDGNENDITGTPLGGGNFSADVSARATLPETIHAGIYKEFANKWGLSLGFRWTRWNRLQEIIIDTDSPFVPDNTLELNWDNTYSANIGIDYFYSDKWTFRAGYMFDESPTNNIDRTPRIPDEDRNWVAIGASYHPNNNLQIDIGYTHILVDDAEINITNDVIAGPPASPIVVTDNVVGEYEDPNVNILSLQAVYKF